MDYQGNSNKQKEKEQKKAKLPEKKVEKVVTGEVKKRSKPLGKRFKETFVGGDIKEATGYVITDVVMPGIRDMVFESIMNGAKRFLYGTTFTPSRTQNSKNSRFSYNNPISRMAVDPRDSVMLPKQSPHRAREAGEIVLQQKVDADQALDQMMTILSMYDVVSLADLYETLGLQSSHTDNKWGWTSLAGSKVVQIREGYLLDLPPMEAI